MSTKILALIAASALFASDDPQRLVLEAQQQWLDGYNHRDEKALAAIEAEDFRVVFGDGSIQTKADQLTNIRKALPAGAKYEIAVETTEVRLYGNAAVLTGIVVEKTQSASQRSRYTDTWIFQKGRWRVVSSHLSDLKSMAGNLSPPLQSGLGKSAIPCVNAERGNVFPTTQA